MAVQAQTYHTGSIAAGTAIGGVALTVPGIQRSRTFYERLLGLSATEHDDGSLSFAPADGPAILHLVADATATPRNPRESGLFHFAVLVPTRRDLAVALVRLVQGGWRISGASDHMVSEAAVPGRSRRQRDRDLSRPWPLAVAPRCPWAA